MIILGPKTAILGPQFCRILVLGPHFWWSRGARAPGVPPGSAPAIYHIICEKHFWQMLISLKGRRTSQVKLFGTC